MGFLKSLLGGVWGYVGAALAAVAGIAAVYLKGQKAGKDAVQAEGLKKEAENVKVANEVERQVATTKPDAVVSKLRDKWSRD